MLSSAACSCLRRGGKLLARAAGSTPRGPWAGSLAARPWSPWVSRPLTDAIGSAGGLTGPGHRPRQSASVSASYGDPSPPTDPVIHGDPPPEAGERFGTLSGDIGSRRSFRKSSPEIQNQRFQEDEEDEEDEEQRRRKPFLARGRNTSYWYFLQCKKLLKENKVGLSPPSSPSHHQCEGDDDHTHLFI